MLKFLASPLGTLAAYLVIGLIGVGTLTGVYYTWKSSIRQEALQEFNKKQIEQVVKNQEEFIQTLKALTVLSEEAKQRLDQKIEEDNQKLSDLDSFLRSQDAQKTDRVSSEVLKRTIELLRKK